MDRQKEFLADGAPLRPGDLFLTTQAGWLSKTIRWGTQQKDETPSYYSHAGSVVKAGSAVPCKWRPQAVIVEAVGKVRAVTLTEGYPDEAETAFFRPTNIHEDDRQAIAAALVARVGERYPYAQLGAFLLDEKLLNGRRVFRKLFGVFRKANVCSPLVAVEMARLGYSFGHEDPATLTPDDLHDFALMNPNKWDILWEGTVAQLKEAIR